MVNKWKPNRENKNGIHVRKVNKKYVLEWLFDKPVDMSNYEPLLKIWERSAKLPAHGFAYNCESGLIYGLAKSDIDKMVVILKVMVKA